MSKQTGKTVVKYKPLFADGESAFKTEGSLDTITFADCYLVEVNHNGADVGLPFEDCNEGHFAVGILIVTDSGINDQLQVNRVTGQVLILTSCKQKATNVYSRTRMDDKWSNWRSLAVTGMFDNISSTDELLATVAGLVDETIRAKQVEVDVMRTAVDISSLAFTAGNGNITITGKSMDGEVKHSIELPAATTEKAGVMSAEDKKVINKLSSSLSEERSVTVGKFIALNNIAVGESLNIEEVSQNGYAYFKENCLPNDVFIVTTSGNNNVAAKNYAILDADNIVLALGNGTSLDKEIIVIPDGGAHLIVNSLSATIKVEKVIDKAASSESVEDIDKRFFKDIPFTKKNAYYSLNSAVNGSTLTEKIIDANGYSYAKIECVEGEKYILSTNGNTAAAKNYAILDKNNIVLALGNTTALVDETVIIPGGGKTLIVNSKTVGASIKKTLVIPSIGYDGENLVIDDLTIPLSGENTSDYTSIKNYFTNNYMFSLFGKAVGDSISINVSQQNNYSFALIPVVKGEEYRLNIPAGGTTSARICCVTDENMTCTFLTTTSSYNGEVVISENGFMIINAKDIDSCTVEKKGGIVTYTNDIPYSRENFYLSLNAVAVGVPFGLKEPIAANGFCYLFMRVFKGQQYIVTTTGNTSYARSFAYFDTRMKCLQTQTSKITNQNITIVEDGYLVVNSKIEGFHVTNIDRIDLRDAKYKVTAEEVDARRYSIADYNNEISFDKLYVGDLKTNVLQLDYNRNIPTAGAFITRDISGKKLPTQHSHEEAQAFYVPFLYLDQQKVGTIVLFDENTGNPFIFDKNGNKKYLKYE